MHPYLSIACVCVVCKKRSEQCEKIRKSRKMSRSRARVRASCVSGLSSTVQYDTEGSASEKEYIRRPSSKNVMACMQDKNIKGKTASFHTFVGSVVSLEPANPVPVVS